jgi:hypothetical protein
VSRGILGVWREGREAAEAMKRVFAIGAGRRAQSEFAVIDLGFFSPPKEITSLRSRRVSHEHLRFCYKPGLPRPMN